KSNFELLEKNITGYKNILAVRCALSNISGAVLNVIDTGGGNWAYKTELSDESTSANVIDSVPTITIDEVLSRFDIPHIDLLKIDIEGAEKELFSNNYENW